MNDFLDPLEYIEGITRGTYLKNNNCSFCGTINVIYSDILPKLEHFAKWSPVAMARFNDIDHADDHFRHLYFDRNMQYVGDIAIPNYSDGYFPSNRQTNPDISWEKRGLSRFTWERISKVVTKDGNNHISLNSIITELNNEFGQDPKWTGVKSTFSLINKVAGFGLLVSCGSGGNMESYVNRQDAGLEINLKKENELIHKDPTFNNFSKEESEIAKQIVIDVMNGMNLTEIKSKHGWEIVSKIRIN